MNDRSYHEELSSTDAMKSEEVTPRDILRFAKSILVSILVLSVLGALTEYVHPGNNIFEACRTVLPSFATLVIGYYFGKM